MGQRVIKSEYPRRESHPNIFVFQIYMHEDEDILLEESFEIQASVLHSCVWT